MAIFHKTLQYHEDTTEKRDISQEDIEFLKKLQLEMNTQDTTGTADPRFWVIKGSERVINNEDPDELCLQVDGSTVTSTTEETVKYLNDNILPDCNIDRGCKIETGYTWDFKLTYTEDGEEEYDDLSTQEVNEFLANNGHDDTMIIGISIRPFMYPNTMFLTEKEAREHLKRNYYHYSEDAHTYCMVAWRSPEVEKLWKILRETKWDCKDKELESHEEKYILHYCISLMQELVGCFEEWYRWVHGENAIEELSEEERFYYNMSYFHIVQELFLFRTYHSGHIIPEGHQRWQNADSLALIVEITLNLSSARGKRMTGKEYQNLAMRTNDHKNSDRIIKKINNNQLVNSDELIIPDIGGVLNGCLGLAGESGEVLDLIKKWVFHENELHVEHLKKELGDVMWYVAMICESMELDIDEIFQMNINKLKVRYPEGFDPDKANHRRADDI